MLKRLPILLVVLVVIGALAGAEANAAPAPKGNYIVVLNDSVADPGAVAAQHARAFSGQVGHVYRHALTGYSVTLPNAALPALRANPDVLFVSEDGDVRATELPTGIDRIDADRSSARSGDGRGSVNINVAVIDSGMGLDRQDLNVVGGIDCVREGKQASFDDPYGHGTHVAGTIAAKDDGPDIPNDPLEIVGVVPGAPLWAVRVLMKNGFGTDSMVICGIDWVTATRADSDPSNDIAVANMSIGDKGADDGNCGLTNRDAVHLAICNSVASGVSYVVSAGNETGDLAAHTPAAYDEVLAVTAMSDFDGKPGALSSDTCPDGNVVDDAPAWFSNFATLPADQAHTVAAPGVCIWSTYIAPFNAALTSGTSMSSPHVAGTVALCIAKGPCAGLTPAQIIQRIVADAAAYNNAHSQYSFAGDPLRPVEGKYYGYLIRAGEY